MAADLGEVPDVAAVGLATTIRVGLAVVDRLGTIAFVGNLPFIGQGADRCKEHFPKRSAFFLMYSIARNNMKWVSHLHRTSP